MTGAGARSPAAGFATMSALAVSGLFTLGRAVVELIWGLSEIAGTSGHWSGDVTLWLVTVLPLPVLVGFGLLAAIPWAGGHATTVSRATAVLLVLAVIPLAWILVEGSSAAAQGSAFGLNLKDPLLWAPIGMLVGAAVGSVLLAALTVRERA